MVNSYGKSYDEKDLGVTDYVGYAIWLVGFAIEVVSDKQKGWFAANPANKGKWIDEGKRTPSLQSYTPKPSSPYQSSLSPL